MKNKSCQYSQWNRCYPQKQHISSHQKLRISAAPQNPLSQNEIGGLKYQDSCSLNKS